MTSKSSMLFREMMINPKIISKVKERETCVFEVGSLLLFLIPWVICMLTMTKIVI